MSSELFEFIQFAFEPYRRCNFTPGQNFFYPVKILVEAFKPVFYKLVYCPNEITEFNSIMIVYILVVVYEMKKRI